jgi:ribosomal protein S18 acetylase RimI-like enzyme
MLATPVAAQSQYRSGPRPINLGRDVRPVLALLNVSFGPVRDSQGRAVADRFSLSQSAPFARRLGMVSRGFIPGFVWEESGQIVGNVTLLESPIHGRYLVANVAVHPDYRRRGIARGLMQEALAHIQSWKGRQIFLQVESDNAAAIELYHSLAFNEVGGVGRWQGSMNTLRFSPVLEEALGPPPRLLRRREWKAARQLDRIGFDPDLNWPGPPPADYYKTGLWQRAADLLNGRRQETWVFDSRPDQGSHLIGLADIVSDWNRPHNLRLCIAPPFRGRLDGSLLRLAVSRLRRIRSGSVWLNYPAADLTMTAHLEQSNFKLRRSLTVMRKNLRFTDSKNHPA